MSKIQYVVVHDAEVRKRRSLTTGEETMVRAVFGSEIPRLGEVTVVDKPHWSLLEVLKGERHFGMAALHPNRVYMPDKNSHRKVRRQNYYDDFSKSSVPLWVHAGFMHEMTHIWQFRVGSKYFSNKSSEELESMSETNAWLNVPTLKEISQHEIFEEMAIRAKHQLEGTIPEKPRTMVIKAADYFARNSTMTAKELVKHWNNKTLLDYNYLIPSEITKEFYKMSQEQQGEVIEDFYTLKEESKKAPQGKTPVVRNINLTWRPLRSLEF